MLQMDLQSGSAGEWSAGKGAEAASAWRQRVVWERTEILPAGTALFRQGRRADTIFLLERGLMKLTCDLADGRQAILCLRLPGHILGWYSHVVAGKYPLSATTLTECRISRMRAETLQSELQRQPQTLRYFLEQQAADLYNVAIALVEAKTLKAPELFARIVRQLIIALEPPRSGGLTRLNLPLSDGDVAAFLGISKEYFNRMKKQLQEDGHFQWDGRTLIIPLNTMALLEQS